MMFYELVTKLAGLSIVSWPPCIMVTPNSA